MIFKRMYSHKDLDRLFDQVIDKMDKAQLDCAMLQVERTIQKNIKKD